MDAEKDTFDGVEENYMLLESQHVCSNKNSKVKNEINVMCCLYGDLCFIWLIMIDSTFV